MDFDLTAFIDEKAKELGISRVAYGFVDTYGYIMRNTDDGIKVNSLIVNMSGRIPQPNLESGVYLMLLHEKGHKKDSGADLRGSKAISEQIANKYAWDNSENPVEAFASAGAVSYLMYHFQPEFEGVTPEPYPPNLKDCSFLTKRQKRQIEKRFLQIIANYK